VEKKVCCFVRRPGVASSPAAMIRGPMALLAAMLVTHCCDADIIMPGMRPRKAPAIDFSEIDFGPLNSSFGADPLSAFDLVCLGGIIMTALHYLREVGRHPTKWATINDLVEETFPDLDVTKRTVWELAVRVTAEGAPWKLLPDASLADVADCAASAPHEFLVELHSHCLLDKDDVNKEPMKREEVDACFAVEDANALVHRLCQLSNDAKTARVDASADTMSNFDNEWAWDSERCGPRLRVLPANSGRSSTAVRGSEAYCRMDVVKAAGEPLTVGTHRWRIEMEDEAVGEIQVGVATMSVACDQHHGDGWPRHSFTLVSASRSKAGDGWTFTLDCSQRKLTVESGGGQPICVLDVPGGPLLPCAAFYNFTRRRGSKLRIARA